MLKITLRKEIDQISSTFIPISYISNNKKTADSDTIPLKWTN